MLGSFGQAEGVLPSNTCRTACCVCLIGPIRALPPRNAESVELPCFFTRQRLLLHDPQTPKNRSVAWFKQCGVPIQFPDPVAGRTATHTWDKELSRSTREPGRVRDRVGASHVAARNHWMSQSVNCGRFGNSLPPRHGVATTQTGQGCRLRCIRPGMAFRSASGTARI